MARHEDTSLLQAALIGYQAEHARITSAIADLRQRLGKSGGHASTEALRNTATPKKHRISAEGRARIAEAQRKRWAAAKKK